MGKLLVVPMLTYGHFNCCLNVGRLLLEYYPEHEVYFLVSDKWAKKLETWEPKFKSLIYMRDEDAWKSNIDSHNQRLKEDGIEKKLEMKSDDALIDLMNNFGDEWQKPRIELMKNFGHLLMGCLETMYNHRTKIDQLVDDLAPDVLLFDTIIMIPFLLNRKWVQVMTINPLFMDHPSLPPYSSGLSSKKKANFEEWKEFRLTNLKHTSDYLSFLNTKLIEEGHQCVRAVNQINESPYLNFYIYPKEIDYYSQSEQIKLPGRWLRLDSSFLPTKQIEIFDLNDRKGRFKRLKELFDVPDDFLKPDTKLIYFSLGSMASAYRKLMFRLMDLIGKVPDHRFIVSKGLLDEEIVLPPNCVGESFVDQFETLKIVDLMISHGGNNTLTECFHLGVKLIIMPLFSDQPDNSRRLIDTQMGYSLDAFNCTLEELNATINEALNNDELTEKIQKISERIRIDNGMNSVVKELHDLIVL